VSWWVPLAFIGAAVVGLVIAFSLTAGRPRTPTPLPDVPEHEGRRKSRYEQDNDVPWNPAAFAALIGGVALLVGIGILIEVV
jgi:hypothetical protein